MKEIYVRELVQAGDSRLIHFNCPDCKAKCFTDLYDPHCNTCEANFSTSPVNLPTSRSRFRLLSGGKRKAVRLNKAVVHQLLNEADGYCAYCDGPHTASYHIEHIIPVAVGGTNNISNLAISCPTCNVLAGSKVFPTVMAKRLYVLHKRKPR